MATLTERFLQGEVVDGKFELRSHLGGSAHSSVFLTQYGDLRPRDAAIKLIPSPPGNSEAQLSLWRLAANLAHPNVMQIWGMGRCDLGRGPMLYVVTELATENLDQIILQRPLSPEEVRETLGPLLDALAFMHSRGYVHTHVKPSNVMAVGEMLKLSSDRICRLGDAVGSAAQPSIHDAPEITRTGATPAGDIWSLGVTLVEVLTQEQITWDTSDRRDPAVPESMPAPYAEFARHCLRRDPKNRWTAADIAAHLPRPTRVAVQAPPVQDAPAEIPGVEFRAPEVTAEEPATNANWSKYMIGTAVFAAMLVAILLGWKLVGGHSKESAAPAASSIVRQPAAKNTTEEARPTPPTSSRRLPVEPPAPTPTRVATPHPAPAPSATASLSSATKTAPPTRPSLAPNTPAPAFSTTVAKGRVLSQVLPDVPKRASETIRGTVRVAVKVVVDSAGNVTNRRLESAGPSRYFAALSLSAAQKWKFSAPVTDSGPAASTWILHFNYTKAGPAVSLVQAEP